MKTRPIPLPSRRWPLAIPACVLLAILSLPVAPAQAGWGPAIFWEGWRDCSLGIAPNGLSHLFYLQSLDPAVSASPYVTYMQNYVSATGPQPPTIYSTVNTILGSITKRRLYIDAQNHPHLYFEDDAGLRHLYSDGTSWRCPLLFQDDDSTRLEDFDVDSSGSVHILTQSAVQKNGLTEYVLTHLARTDGRWARGVGGATHSQQELKMAALALDRNSNAHIVYQVGSVIEYYCSDPDVIPDGYPFALWLPDPLSYAYDIKIACDGNGNPHIAVAGEARRFINSRWGTYLSYAGWSGNTWQKAVIDFLWEPDDVRGNWDFELDPQGIPHVVYPYPNDEDLNSRDEVRHARWNGTGFDIDTVKRLNNDEKARHLDLAFDQYGDPHVCYFVPGMQDEDGIEQKLHARVVYTYYRSPPELSWTGESSAYVQDGLNPETGTVNDRFVFRVKYTDRYDLAPAQEAPVLVIQDATSGIEIYRDRMTAATANPPPFRQGRVYVETVQGVQLGRGNYKYHFETANDQGWVATGAPTEARPGPVVLNSAPKLSWTGEPGYDDGADNNSPDLATPVNFRVNYKDADGDAPQGNVLQLHILDSNLQPVQGSPFTMTDMLLEQSLRSGKTYHCSRTLPRGCYTYYFTAQDRMEAAATGDPTTARQSLCVTGLKIGGFVKDLAGQGWAGIRVDLDGAETKNTTTDAKGGYMFEVGQPGSYRVYVAAQQGLSFRTTPGGQPDYPLPAVTHSLSPLDFQAQGLRISGRVTRLALGSVQGLSGVVVKACAASGLPVVIRSATTDIQGRYTLEVAPGRYNVIPSKTGYKFDPAVRIYSVNGIYANRDYTAYPVTP